MQLQAVSRESQSGSLQLKGGDAASSREEGESIWVTACEGRGRSFKQGAGGVNLGHCRSREGTQFQAGSRWNQSGSLQLKGGDAASSREQGESIWVTPGEGRGGSFKQGAGESAGVTVCGGRGAASSREQEESAGVTSCEGSGGSFEQGQFAGVTAGHHGQTRPLQQQISLFVM